MVSEVCCVNRPDARAIVRPRLPSGLTASFLPFNSGNQFCRLVREALTELDLPHEIQSVGKGSPRRQTLIELAGKSTAPYLVDPNTGKAMGESADIVEYLYRTYADQV